MFRLVLGWLLSAAALSAHAEPYLAVQSGLRCAQCHFNQTGGGLRTPLGHRFAQTQLAARDTSGQDAWLGRLSDYFAVGADVRASAMQSHTSQARRSERFDLREARVYLAASPLPERLAFYLDQFVAPGVSSNREAFLLYRAADASHYVKAGRFYLPFGWRLQDGSALVGLQTAIDMNGSDRGVEVGWDRGPVSVQFAISNGTFGAAEVDRGKQYSLQAAWIDATWRAGAAINFNDQAAGDRTAIGLFGGWRSGPVSWLAEVAAVSNEDRVRSLGALLEGNWRVAQGHNLKFTAEALDPGGTSSRQTRLSAVYEATPIPWLQLRAGLRRHDDPSAAPGHVGRLGFLELHAFF